MKTRQKHWWRDTTAGHQAGSTTQTHRLTLREPSLIGRGASNVIPPQGWYLKKIPTRALILGSIHILLRTPPPPLSETRGGEGEF